MALFDNLQQPIIRDFSWLDPTHEKREYQRLMRSLEEERNTERIRQQMLKKAMAFDRKMIGRKFGRLTVKWFTRVDEKQRLYFCVCDCGGVTGIGFKEVSGVQLRAGRVKSCGCLNHEQALSPEEKEASRLLQNQRKREKRAERKRQEEALLDATGSIYAQPECALAQAWGLPKKPK